MLLLEVNLTGKHLKNPSSGVSIWFHSADQKLYHSPLACQVTQHHIARTCLSIALYPPWMRNHTAHTCTLSITTINTSVDNVAMCGSGSGSGATGPTFAIEQEAWKMPSPQAPTANLIGTFQKVIIIGGRSARSCCLVVLIIISVTSNSSSSISGWPKFGLHIHTHNICSKGHSHLEMD